MTTVYRWELTKLRFQKRTYLGLGAAVVVLAVLALARFAAVSLVERLTIPWARRAG